MNEDQRRIISEQTKANERMVKAVELGNGATKCQTPANERIIIKQTQPNERLENVNNQKPTDKK